MRDAMTGVAAAPGAWVERFAALAAPNRMPLADVRLAALERFTQLGFPTMRDEDWRFTNVAPIAGAEFRPPSPDGAASGAGRAIEPRLADPTWPRLVFVDGYLDAASSSVDGLRGVTARGLAESLARPPAPLSAHLARHAPWDQDAFCALNTAFMTDGAYVHAPKGTAAGPLHLVFVSTGEGEPAASHPRNLIVVEEGAELTIVEEYVGLHGTACFTNAVTEIIAGDGAVVDHYKIAREASTAYHVGATRLHQGRDSDVRSSAITIGGALVRHNITAVLDGTGGHCHLGGLYLMSGRELVDNHLRVEHASPHCDSREFFKGILEDRARAVFTGRIVVHKDAQKTDAKQTNMNLLLSEDAQVDTKPQLEIFADDVKCTHGATIGQVDDDAIFYLRSRGIPAEAARGVLVYAFAAESLDEIRPGPLRKQLRDVLFDRLPHGGLLREAL